MALITAREAASQGSGTGFLVSDDSSRLVCYEIASPVEDSPQILATRKFQPDESGNWVEVTPHAHGVFIPGDLLGVQVDVPNFSNVNGTLEDLVLRSLLRTE